jgi:hypothetical protein
MGPIATRIAILFVSLTLAACSSHAQPPAGRWQGVFEDQGLIVVVRMEIDAQGQIRVSAPNAIGTFKSDEQRDAVRTRLANELNRTWSAVAPLPLEFDGKDFRKPGGVAPQLEWDDGTKGMTMIFYSGNRASVRVPLAPVPEFADAES